MAKSIKDLRGELRSVRKENKALKKNAQDLHEKLLKVLGVLLEERLIDDEEHEELSNLIASRC